jgi:DNA-binding transcriptional MocR family regulator
MSKNMAIVRAELDRRQYALSIESLSRICGMNHTLIGQALAGLRHRGLIRAIRLADGRIVYKSRQKTFFNHIQASRSMA